ncbi:MAG TPA: PEP-CTERM sorting domain-containing protein [Verrucomicrobiota bacterium]|nr:hypothetical protein [Verrucomicrobiales bacterium]HRI15436.1 PEP-CTERM sorting domain-containing protein [Verrucomicrobiota bacterium]
MKKFQLILLGLGLICWANPMRAQHGHLNAGALGTNQGDALMFVNGADFAASSGYVKVLNPALTGPYAGYFEGGITPTAVHSLSGTDGNGIPYVANPNGAALGSFLEMAIVSVEGPAGGGFQFWEDEAEVPTLSYSVGYSTTAPTDLIVLSDASSGAGTPGGDPYGHLHGRRFSTSTEGSYTVGFQLFDTSANGVGGGPLQSPSDILYIRFDAVPEPGTVALGAMGATAVAWLIRRRQI